MAAASETTSEAMHATVIAIDGRGALIVGPSGSGKSDLALRLATADIRCGDRVLRPVLVADDQVHLERRGNAIHARCPESLGSLIEARGVGILTLPHLPEAQIVLVVDVTPGATVERLPDPGATHAVLGVALPRLALRAVDASSPAKIALCLAGQVVVGVEATEDDAA